MSLRRRGSVFGILLTAVLLAGCAASPSVAPRVTVRVAAAASLVDVVQQLADRYQQSNPGVRMQLSFGSSAQLVQQVLAGAPLDLLVTADEEALLPLQQRSAVRDSVIVATNSLALAVSVRSSVTIAGLSDLGRPGVRVALCAAQVPCGRAARTELRQAGVTLTAPTEESDVRAVLAKVVSGEVDAGLVYRSDVLAGGSAVRSVPIAADVANRYPAAVLAAAQNPAGAADFRRFLRAAEGQSAFQAAGFGPAGG